MLLAWVSKGSLLSFVQGFKGPQKFVYYMMLPAFVGIFAVIIYPFFYNIAISFSNFSLRTFQDWSIVGLHHYANALTDPKFYALFGKTIAWTVVNVFFHVTLGVFLAVVINQVMPAKGFWRTLFIIPWAVPQYITALTWRGMFNQEYGPINQFLQQFLHLSPVQWLSQPFTAFTACIITNVWLGFPFMMIVALGGLQSIPHSLYEAAYLDKANAWQRFRHITLPLLMPVMIPAALLGSIWTFNNLNIVWLVSNAGEPGDQTHILVSYVYKAAFNLYRYGYAAAVSVLIFLILVLWSLGSLRSQYRKETR
ncbi:MAG: ABC transporter permease [Bdellovibrio sp. ArHS]|nr:MAG: ABC transporter permease [Bdellovibrio sp. ArHS]